MKGINSVDDEFLFSPVDTWNTTVLSVISKFGMLEKNTHTHTHTHTFWWADALLPRGLSEFLSIYLYIQEYVRMHYELCVNTGGPKTTPLLLGRRKSFAYMYHPKDHSLLSLEHLGYMAITQTDYKVSKKLDLRKNKTSSTNLVQHVVEFIPPNMWPEFMTPRSNAVGFQKWIHESRRRSRWSWGGGGEAPEKDDRKWRGGNPPQDSSKDREQDSFKEIFVLFKIKLPGFLGMVFKCKIKALVKVWT